MTIEIRDPEIETMLRRMAEERGLTPEELVAQLARAKCGAVRKQRGDIRAVAAELRREFGLEALEGTPPLPKTFYDELSGE